MPALSSARATHPPDWWQRGQTGTSRAASARASHRRDNCWSDFVADAEHIAEVAHQANGGLGEASDGSVSNKLLEPVDGIHQVDVSLRRSDIEVRVPDSCDGRRHTMCVFSLSAWA
jgi:hypothetical protein